MDKIHVSDRLNKAVALWEDVCFLVQQFTIAGLRNKKYKNSRKPDFQGPVKHYKEFRQHILKNAVDGDYDYDKFTGSYELSAGVLRNVGPLPMNLFAWNKHSRKTLSLTSNVQTLLSATSLDGFTWQDIKWPFKSFVLTLDDPIIGARDKEYDIILVSEVGGFIDRRDRMEMKHFILFPRTLCDYKSLDKQKISKAVKKGRISVEKIKKKLLLLTEGILDEFHVTTRGYKGDILTDPVSQSLEADQSKFTKRLEVAGFNTVKDLTQKMEEEDIYMMYSACDKAQHIVLSTCMYMESLSMGNFSDHDSNKKRNSHLETNECAMVTCPDDIFDITLADSDLYEKSVEIVSEIHKTRVSREKSVHWRRGHWRKAWGSYGSVNAPKTWIQPCLVNKDRLENCSLPLAGKSNLV
ncbi:MAG: hypothetical protein ACKUBY_04025 [Candidatus Moraniibacteriota bacterium]|jgi:hypothetical protein